MNWKNLSLFGREILDDAGYKSLQEIIKTQIHGEPIQAYKGAAMQRQDPVKFKAAISDFHTTLGKITDDLVAKSSEIQPEDSKKAIELLRRSELLYMMANTESVAHEAWRRANIESGKNYTATMPAMWRRLENALGHEEKIAERVSVRAMHLPDYSFR